MQHRIRYYVRSIPFIDNILAKCFIFLNDFKQFRLPFELLSITEKGNKIKDHRVELNSSKSSAIVHFV